MIGISTNDAAGFAKLGGWFHNKLILLGDADPLGGMDSANVPARAEPVPGVYLHACGAYTLGRAPLYRLEIWFGMTLAVLCFLAAVMMVHWVCLKYAGRYQVTGTPLTVVLSLALLGLFLLAAVLLARWLHVLWLEVIALCVVLVMHCFVEILLRTVKWEHFRESAVKPFIVASSSKKKRG